MNVFDLYAKISIDTSEYEKGLKSASTESKSLAANIGSGLQSAATSGAGALQKVGTAAKAVASRVGDVVVAAAKIGGAMTAAGAAGVVALTKSALDAYGEYEQLVGGVETLFADSAGIVQQYAAKAYQTAGISANAYMDTVTSFSASLLQGLGGNTQQAAEMANLAITDMSDNANKMGTSMGMIQDAYQGFAKQNYTMLDNLKLGYGGTQEEMIRLINDSGILNETISSLDGITFDQIVQAIHEVQTTMGITGTTALEASTTIQGSVSSMKSAWENLKIGLADDTADMDVLINDFVESAGTAAGNILPRIETILFGIGTLVTNLAPVLSSAIVEIVPQVLPGLISAAAQMVAAFIQAIVVAGPSLLAAGQSALMEVGNGITSAFPQLQVVWDGAVQIFESIDGALDVVSSAMEDAGITWGDVWAAISDAISTASNIISSAITGIAGIIGTVVTGIADFVTWMQSGSTGAEAFKAVIVGITAAFVAYEVATTAAAVAQGVLQGATTLLSGAQAALNAVMSANPLGIVALAVTALVAAVLYLWNTNEGFREAVTSAWEAIKSTAETVFNAVAGFFTETIPNAIESALGYFDNLMNGSTEDMNAIETVVSTVLNNVKTIFSTVFSAIQSIVNAAMSALSGDWSGALESMKTAATTIWDGIKTVFQNKIDAAKQIVSSALDTIKGYFTDKLNAAKNTVTSIFDSIKTAISDKITAAKNTVSSVIDTIKSKFNFSWSLPHLKLPHLSVSGRFSINPPSVPHFSIAWYKKAMDMPMILNGATIFGAMGGNLLGGGESGSEIVAGKDTLMDMIQEASGANDIKNALKQLVDSERSPVQIIINGADYESKRDLAETIGEIITRDMQRRGMALA